MSYINKFCDTWVNTSRNLRVYSRHLDYIHIYFVIKKPSTPTCVNSATFRASCMTTTET